MYSKQIEIEEIVDDLIENSIIETLINTLSSKKECDVAIEILKEKLEEFDNSVFQKFFE